MEFSAPQSNNADRAVMSLVGRWLVGHVRELWLNNKQCVLCL